MSDELCLAVDLGTTGLKVGLVTLGGEVIDTERQPVVTDRIPDGGATQDAARWWEQVCASARRLTERLGNPDRVRAVAVTGQYASTVPVDANGTPTGPCLTWLDTRGRTGIRRRVGGPVMGYSPRKVAQFVRKTGGAPSVSGDDPIAHMIFLQQTSPELVEATRWFLEPVEYLTMRFCGVAAATHASRLATWLTDNRDLSILAYDAGLLDLVGLDDQRLPPLQPFGSLVGAVKGDLAADLGLSRDAVVVSGMPDLHAGAIGSGGVEDYQAHLALSTSSWISCPIPRKKTDALHSIASIPGITDHSYLVINNQQTGAGALEWLRASIGGPAPALGYDDLTGLAATSRAGAGGVLFTPWLAGERSPVEDKRVRGGFSGLSITSTTADLVRAVMEGVAGNSAWLLTYVEKFTGHRLEPVRLLGGGAQSELWCQIYADTLNREVEQVPNPMYAQLGGAAVAAAAAMGGSPIARARPDAPRGRVFSPNAPEVEVYQRQSRFRVDRFRAQRRWARREPRP